MKFKRHTQRKFLFLLGIVIFTVIITNIILYFLNDPKQTKKYDMHLIVGDRVGFDLNREVLTFGMVTRSGTATRHIGLANSEQTNKIIITASGELADWITVSENNFILEPNESKVIDITVFVPANAEFGNYAGTLKTKFIQIKNA